MNELTYQALRDTYSKGYPRNIESTNRVIFFDEENKHVYKLAKNMLGFDSNQEEVRLSKKEKAFVNSNPLHKDDYSIIKCDLIKTTKETHITQLTSLDNLVKILDYNYFVLGGDRMKRRNIPLEGLEQKVGILKNIPLEGHLGELVRLSTEYNLEPCDMLRDAFIVDGELKILDFGLTEKCYFDNIRTLAIFKGEHLFRTILIKQFDGTLKVHDDFLKNVKEDTLEEFLKNEYGREVDFSDDSIYDSNNMFIIRK